MSNKTDKVISDTAAQVAEKLGNKTFTVNSIDAFILGNALVGQFSEKLQLILGLAIHSDNADERIKEFFDSAADVNKMSRELADMMIEVTIATKNVLKDEQGRTTTDKASD